MEAQTASAASTQGTTQSVSEDQPTPQVKTIPWGGNKYGDVRSSAERERTSKAAKEAGERTEARQGENKQASGAGNKDPGQSKKETPKVEDEFEEVAIGANKFKVQKGLQAIVKQWERSIQGKQRELAEEKRRLTEIPEEEFFKLRNKNAKDFAENLLIKELENAQKSPDQRRAETAEQELSRYRKQEQDRAQQDKHQREEAEVKTHYNKATEDFLGAWKESGLPATQGFGTMVAMELYRSEKLREDGIVQTSLTAKEAAAKVKREWLAHNRSVYSSFNPEQLEETIGADVLKKWREFDVSRVTQRAPTTANQANSKPTYRPGAQPPASNTKLTENEWRDWRASGLDLDSWRAQRAKRKSK